MKLNIQAQPLPTIKLQYLDKLYYSPYLFNEVSIFVLDKEISVNLLLSSSEKAKMQIAEGSLTQKEFDHALKIIENIISLKVSPILFSDKQNGTKLFDVNFAKTSIQPEQEKAEICFVLKHDPTKEITNLNQLIDILLS